MLLGKDPGNLQASRQSAAWRHKPVTNVLRLALGVKLPTAR